MYRIVVIVWQIQHISRRVTCAISCYIQTFRRQLPSTLTTVTQSSGAVLICTRAKGEQQQRTSLFQASDLMKLSDRKLDCYLSIWLRVVWYVHRLVPVLFSMQRWKDNISQSNFIEQYGSSELICLQKTYMADLKLGVLMSDLTLLKSHVKCSSCPLSPNLSGRNSLLMLSFATETAGVQCCRCTNCLSLSSFNVWGTTCRRKQLDQVRHAGVNGSWHY